MHERVWGILPAFVAWDLHLLMQDRGQDGEDQKETETQI